MIAQIIKKSCIDIIPQKLSIAYFKCARETLSITTN